MASAGMPLVIPEPHDPLNIIKECTSNGITDADKILGHVLDQCPVEPREATDMIRHYLNDRNNCENKQ
jgi:hypothetical protein